MNMRGTKKMIPRKLENKGNQEGRKRKIIARIWKKKVGQEKEKKRSQEKEMVGRRQEKGFKSR